MDSLGRNAHLEHQMFETDHVATDWISGTQMDRCAPSVLTRCDKKKVGINKMETRRKWVCPSFAEAVSEIMQGRPVNRRQMIRTLAFCLSGFTFFLLFPRRQSKAVRWHVANSPESPNSTIVDFKTRLNAIRLLCGCKLSLSINCDTVQSIILMGFNFLGRHLAI